MPTPTLPPLPEPYSKEVIATWRNTQTVRQGYEMGGYVKTPALFSDAQMTTYGQACADAARADLLAEVERLRKSLALVQQHHATAWNRGHTMGMAANRQIAREAQEAVARDAWDNTRLTEALLAAEAEVERLRVDAKRWQAIRECGSLVQLYLYDDPDDPLSGDWVYKAHPSQFDALADAMLKARATGAGHE